MSEERMDGTSGFLRQKEQLGDKQPQINHSKTKYRHVNTQDDQTHTEDFTDVNIKKNYTRDFRKSEEKRFLPFRQKLNSSSFSELTRKQSKLN